MKTIETTATVTEDGQMIVEVPSDVPTGKHRVVVIIDERPLQTPNGRSRSPFQLPAHAAGLTDDNFTFRREDLYD